MKPTIYACITTRDGNIRNDVTGTLITASSNAKRAGYEIGAGRQMYQHGTAVCRNKAVADFMKMKVFSHILFIDDDVLLPPDSITKLARLAERDECAIATAGYPTLRMTAPGIHYLYVTLLPLDGETNDQWMATFPTGIEEVKASGAGCLMIRKDVFEAVGFPWFRWPERWDQAKGEVETITDDVDFCVRAREKGFRVWADGTIHCGHLKTIDLMTLLDGSLKSQADMAIVPNDYGSHMPALQAIAKHTKIRKVVEYGSGRFSTPLFLDRRHFPDVTNVISFESNESWFRDCKFHNKDERLDLFFCPLEEMPTARPPLADLVFIDCDRHERGKRIDYSLRGQLIKAHESDELAIIVVHDSNFDAIAPMVENANFRYKMEYVPLTGAPSTAVMSNGVDVTKIQWKDG